MLLTFLPVTRTRPGVMAWSASLAGDAALLLLVVVLFPVVVLLIGMPIALLVWAAGEIANRLL